MYTYPEIKLQNKQDAFCAMYHNICRSIFALCGAYEGEGVIRSAVRAAGEASGAEQLKKLEPRTTASSGAAETSASGTDTAQPSGEVQTPAASAPYFRAFSFSDLDSVIRASGAARAFTGTSSLYKSPHDGHYVLVLSNTVADADEFSRACNIIAEYGHMIRTVQNTLYYYDEHYDVIAAGNAIGKLSQI